LTICNFLFSCHQGPIQNHYGLEQQKWPQLVFIIVGKRHHFRFFPDPRTGAGADAKGNGNLYPGFVVDQGKLRGTFKVLHLKIDII
jgi:eukaryotic translation initiation factor 2C